MWLSRKHIGEHKNHSCDNNKPMQLTLEHIKNKFTNWRRGETLVMCT